MKTSSTSVYQLSPRQAISPSHRTQAPQLLSRKRLCVDGLECFSYQKLCLGHDAAGVYIQKVYRVAGFQFSTIRRVVVSSE